MGVALVLFCSQSKLFRVVGFNRRLKDFEDFYN